MRTFAVASRMDYFVMFMNAQGLRRSYILGQMTLRPDLIVDPMTFSFIKDKLVDSLRVNIRAIESGIDIDPRADMAIAIIRKFDRALAVETARLKKNDKNGPFNNGDILVSKSGGPDSEPETTVDKLVRDKVLGNMRAKGYTFTSKVEKGEALLNRLRAKARKEFTEVRAASTMKEFVEELADLLEVLLGLKIKTQQKNP